jgi:hypothetical protein
VSSVVVTTMLIVLTMRNRRKSLNMPAYIAILLGDHTWVLHLPRLPASLQERHQKNGPTAIILHETLVLTRIGEQTPEREYSDLS